MSVATPEAPRRPVSPEFVGLLKQAVLALAIFHFAFLLFYWVPDNWIREDRTRDLTVYYDAAMRLKHGAPLYQPWPNYTPADFPSRFFYPPPFVLLTRPLVELPYIWFGRIWTSSMLVAFWIYAASLAKMATGKLNWKAILIAGLTIDLLRGNAALGFGNFEPVMWACYGLTFSTSVRAVPLAFAAMMKLHPVWVLMLVIKEERRKALFPALLLLVLDVGAGIWLCGWDNSAQWWAATSPVVSQGTFVSDNISPSFALIRVLHGMGAIEASAPLPIWAKAYLSLMAVGGPLLTVVWSRRQPKELRYALVACATILFAPLCWSIYLPLLLAPAAIWFRLRSDASL